MTGMTVGAKGRHGGQMDRVLTGYSRRLNAQNAPRNCRSITYSPAIGRLVLCAIAVGFSVCLGWSLPVPDTIKLPDSLGPLRPGYHLAFGGPSWNIYVASESSDIIVVDGKTFQRIKRINTCLLYTSPSPRDGLLSRMPSSA